MTQPSNAKSNGRVLLVDDDTDLLHLITVRLEANGYCVCAVDNGETALQRLASFKPQVVITDMKMPGMDGMALFDAIQQHSVSLPVIVLTAHGTIPDAVDATQQGIFGFLVKPFDAKILLYNVERAIRQSGQLFDTSAGAGDLAWREEIITRSPLMEALLKQAHAAANSDANVLVQSETGTGKELLARAMHKASARKNAPFMTLNCAAIPENLIESELFGHSAGSFTGANRAHSGLFLAANGGTVFLDEIGDMPLAAQAKLLRVLEQREIRAVGSTRTVPIDVRIITATHHDLQARVSEGEFREDLYYRLDVIKLELPTLNDRREDIPLLVNHFCHLLAEKSNRLCHFSNEALELLVSAPWPGNVRQLVNVIEQCSVLSPTPMIARKLVETSLRFRTERLLSLNSAKKRFERDYLVRLLNLTEGNIALASRLSERNRTEFYNLLRRHGLDPEHYRRNT